MEVVSMGVVVGTTSSSVLVVVLVVVVAMVLVGDKSMALTSPSKALACSPVLEKVITTSPHSPPTNASALLVVCKDKTIR